MGEERARGFDFDMGWSVGEVEWGMLRPDLRGETKIFDVESSEKKERDGGGAGFEKNQC